MFSKRVCATALVATSLLATACGGSSSGSSSGSHGKQPPNVTITKKSFLAQAQSVCTGIYKQHPPARAPGPHASALNVADYVQAQADVSHRVLSELQQLALPPHDSAPIRAVFAELNTFIADLYDVSDALRLGEDKTALDVQIAKLKAQAALADSAIRAYGIRVCATD